MAIECQNIGLQDLGYTLLNKEIYSEYSDEERIC